jgi:hypothetical protein
MFGLEINPLKDIDENIMIYEYYGYTCYIYDIVIEKI